MRKWAFLISTVAAVAVSGCGGSGGGASGGPGGGVGGPNVSSVNLSSTPGMINVQYLTGQGRALNDMTAVINGFGFTDSASQFAAPASGAINLSLLLTGYTSQTASLNVPVALGTNSRTFTSFELQVTSLSTGGVTYTGQLGQNLIDQTFPASFLVETGRLTTFPVYLDDSMISFDANNNVVFDSTQFQNANFPPNSAQMLGFFGDYVMFDISAMSSLRKPLLSDSSIADRVYFSGDNTALSGSASTGLFEVLTTTGVIDGQYTPAITDPGTFPTPGTYTLLAPNPADVTNTSKIASIQGIYRPFTSVPMNTAPGPLDAIAFPGTFEAIVFPGSDENPQPDLVMIKRDLGGSIAAMYFGGVDYSQNPPTYSVWPIDQVVTATTDNELSGTLDTLKDSAGGTPDTSTTAGQASVRYGHFTETARNITTEAPPLGWPTSGRFIVYRVDGTGLTVGPAILKTRALHPHRRMKQSVVQPRRVSAK